MAPEHHEEVESAEDSGLVSESPTQDATRHSTGTRAPMARSMARTHRFFCIVACIRDITSQGLLCQAVGRWSTGIVLSPCMSGEKIPLVLYFCKHQQIEAIHTGKEEHFWCRCDSHTEGNFRNYS